MIKKSEPPTVDLELQLLDLYTGFLVVDFFLWVVLGTVRVVSPGNLRGCEVIWSVRSWARDIRGSFSSSRSSCLQSKQTLIQKCKWLLASNSDLLTPLKKMSFATNSNFLIPLSLQPDVIDLWYLKNY